MIVDLNDSIDLENDGMNEEGNFPMTGFIRMHKPQAMITDDFRSSISPSNPGTDIFFIAYASNA
ncbi:MAG: hypothetical protein WAX69_07320 [Victivallales bacterium]